MNRQHAPEVAGGASMSGAPTALERDVLRRLHTTVLEVRIPTTISGLAAMTGAGRRDIEAAVETLRLRGEPIVGGNEGLRLTENPDELAAYIEARRRRMASIYLGSRALRRTLRRMREAHDLTLWGTAA